MKAKSFQLKALLPQIQTLFDVIFLYGTDDGEIHHTFVSLKQLLGISGDSMNSLTLTKEALKKTPFLATDEANTASLISGRRFLFVLEDSGFSIEALRHFLTQKQTDALLIIRAGNLPKTNALRIEAEKNPRILALACYEPKEADIQRTIFSYLQDHKKSITPSVLQKLCQKISFNQQLILQELDKLILYLGEEKIVTQAAIDACLTDSAEVSTDNFCVCVAQGQVEAVLRFLDILSAQANAGNTLISALQDYFEKLLIIVSDTSHPLEQAIEATLRPAQFALKKPLASQARFWTKEALLETLDKLNHLKALTRTTGYVSNTLCFHAFLSLALMARKLSRLR